MAAKTSNRDLTAKLAFLTRTLKAPSLAAMIYQHATRDHDHAIAAALDAPIDEARGTSQNKITA